MTAEVQRIRRLRWPGLQRLWRHIDAGTTDDWQAGKALEHLFLRAFELDDAEITWPYPVSLLGTSVEQIDGAIYCGGLSCLVECKDTGTPQNIEPLAKLRNQLARRPSGTIGLAVSRKGFTFPATTLAHFLAPQTVLLYEGGEIEFLLEKREMVRPLLKKYRMCVEQGIPNYTTQEEDIP